MGMGCGWDGDGMGKGMGCWTCWCVSVDDQQMWKRFLQYSKSVSKLSYENVVFDKMSSAIEYENFDVPLFDSLKPRAGSSFQVIDG